MMPCGAFQQPIAIAAPSFEGNPELPTFDELFGYQIPNLIKPIAGPDLNAPQREFDNVEQE